ARALLGAVRFRDDPRGRSRITRNPSEEAAMARWRRAGRRAAGRRGLVGFAVPALAWALGWPAAARAQETGRVVGTVTDPSGAPLAEVQVFVPGTGLGSLTRADGRFLVLGIPA